MEIIQLQTMNLQLLLLHKLSPIPLSVTMEKLPTATAQTKYKSYTDAPQFINALAIFLYLTHAITNASISLYIEQSKAVSSKAVNLIHCHQYAREAMNAITSRASA